MLPAEEFTFADMTSTNKAPLHKLIEETENTPGQPVIAYRKYQLSNGLTLIIHKDTADPLVHVEVTYHVGSACEEVGLTGFAHLFEHMMFQETKNVADQQHFKVVTEAGGTLNGSTSRDRTNYYQTVPANQLEKILWLESDRMGFFIEGVTEKKFEIQRATVKNEKQQNYDNRPYGRTIELFSKSFYPEGHPYNWPVIGFVEDLDRATIEDLQTFFMRYYSPNNAVLAVGGDVDFDEVVALAEKYFGPIPAGPQVKSITPRPVKLKKNSYISLEDDIHMPMLQVVYPGAEHYHKDEAALDILADMLGGSRNSFIYRDLVKSGKAVQANVSHPAYELAGEFRFTGLAYPGKNLTEMEQQFLHTLQQFAKEGITEEELERAKNVYISHFIYSIESVKGKCGRLTAYEMYLQQPGFINKDIERYRSVTTRDVQRVLEQYLLRGKYLALSVVPKGQPELAAAEDNLETNEETTAYTHLPPLAVRTTPETFDRSKIPGAGKPKAPKVPEFYREKFTNGLEIIGHTSAEVPSVAFRVNIRCGALREQKGQYGLAWLTGHLLMESTTTRSSEELSVELEKLGSRVDVSVGKEYITLGAHCLSDKLAPTLRLVEEMLFTPAFTEEDFDLVKKQQLEYISNNKKQAGFLADTAFYEVLYGKEHPFGTPVIGLQDRVTAFNLNDVKEYYNNWFAPNITDIVVVGDVEEKEWLKQIEHFSNWQGRLVEPTQLPPIPQRFTCEVFLIDKPDAPQSEIRIGYVALPWDEAGDFYSAQVMNYPLGGAFNSRINLNLREEKGYTYGAGAYFAGSHQPGPFTAYTSVRADATADAVNEIVKEIRQYREAGPTEEELKFTKNSLLLRDALKYETNTQKAGFLNNILHYKLAENFVEKQKEVLNRMTMENMHAIAEKFLPIERMAIVVAGNAEQVRNDLENLQLGPIHLMETEPATS